MDYEKRIVCYFDILGFKRVVCERKLSADEIGRMFSEIDELIKEEGENVIDSIYFSDSFVVSIKQPTQSLKHLRLIVEILHKLLKYGLLARGGVAYGDLLHVGAKVYGPALVKAVEVEHKATYPRILLDESLSECIMPTFGNGIIDYTRYLTDFVYIKTDPVDGKPYIDYVSPILEGRREDDKDYLSILQRMIKEGLASGDAKLIGKYEWLQEKLSLRS